MFPLHQRRALSRIEDEVIDKFFGCGSPLPPAIEGCTVLNLGCGTGRDVYLASQLVGPDGYVVGIDMSNDEFERYVASQLSEQGYRLFTVDGDEEQLAVARRHIGAHMDRFGFGRPNVDFRQGYPEDLAACGIADESVDLVIANCGLNLSPDKERLFREVFRVLKPGGEFYFANIFSGRHVPPELRDDPEFYAECYGGALTLEEFGRLLKRVGFMEYRVVSESLLEPSNPVSAAKGGEIDFYSMKVRLFKFQSLEEICEDYGQSAMYLGTIPELPDQFALDQDHLFWTGESVPVCGDTAAILIGTRYALHFRVDGDHSVNTAGLGHGYRTVTIAVAQ
jgi:ubiquinone/menaquinone biosynthesis C-methylase UbiE